MKKVIAVLILSTLCLVSCGKENDSSVTSKNTPSSKSQEQIAKDIVEIQANGEEMDMEEFTGTMEEILKRGGKMTCTVKSEEMQLEGVMYIDGEKIRSSVTTEMNGKKMETNTLILDDYSYMWTSDMNTGTKFKTEDDEDEMDDEFMEEDTTDEEYKDNMTFACKKGVNESYFDVPSDIKFTEFNEDIFMEEAFGEGFEIPEGAEVPEGFEMPSFE